MDQQDTLKMTGIEWNSLYTILCDNRDSLMSIPTDRIDEHDADQLRDTLSILSKMENPDEAS